jgi:hypothetical protein
MNRLEQKSRALLVNERRLEPVSVEKNMVGFCTRCGSDLFSLAYHRTEKGWLVSARCEKEHPLLIAYDNEWGWLGDQELQVYEETGAVQSIQREQLEAVFTPAEIRDMLAYERGESYTRQNLYRAKAKFERFEKLFGIKIKL